MITLCDFVKLVKTFGPDHPIVEIILNTVRYENKPR